VDDSVWMAGAGSSVLDRAVIILLALGFSTTVVFVYRYPLLAQMRLLRWAIRRPLHRCAGCHARNSSVALWGGLQASGPCWLCAECAFGVRDFDEVPRSPRQPAVQIASRVEQAFRAAALWFPTVGGGGKHYRPPGAHIASRVPTVGGGGRHRRTAQRPFDLASPPVGRGRGWTVSSTGLGEIRS
jgi:hypothetical protein